MHQRLKITTVTAILCFTLSFTVQTHAQTHVQSKDPSTQAVSKTEQKNEEQPTALQTADKASPGYQALVVDFLKVREQMRSDIKNGKGDMWVKWMRRGILRHEPLFYWLLGEWHWQKGNKDQAYITTVQALMLSKTENALCEREGSTEKQRQMRATNHMLHLQKDIVLYKPHKNITITAIYRGGKTLERMLEEGKAMSGQMCFLEERLAGADLKNIKNRVQDSSYDKLKREVESVKKEMDYQKALQESSIQESLSADSLKKKK